MMVALTVPVMLSNNFSASLVAWWVVMHRDIAPDKSMFDFLSVEAEFLFEQYGKDPDTCMTSCYGIDGVPDHMY